MPRFFDSVGFFRAVAFGLVAAALPAVVGAQEPAGFRQAPLRSSASSRETTPGVGSASGERAIT